MPNLREKLLLSQSSLSCEHISKSYNYQTINHIENSSYHGDGYSYNTSSSSSSFGLLQNQRHLSSCPLFLTSSSSLSTLISTQYRNIGNTNTKTHCYFNDSDYRYDRFDNLVQEEKNNDNDSDKYYDKRINQQKLQMMRSSYSCPSLPESINDNRPIATTTIAANSPLTKLVLTERCHSKPISVVIKITSILFKKTKHILRKSCKITAKYYKTKFGQLWLIISAIKNYNFLLTFYYPIPLFGIIAALYPTIASLFQPTTFDLEVIGASIDNGDDENKHRIVDDAYDSNVITQECNDYDFCSRHTQEDDDEHLSPISIVEVEFASSDEWGHFADFFEDEHHNHKHHLCNNTIEGNINTSSSIS